MNSTQTLSISELRQHTAKAVKNVVATQKPTVIFQRSVPKAVLVEYEYYSALEEAVLDMRDSEEAERAKKEPRSSFDSYLQKRWGSTKP